MIARRRPLVALVDDFLSPAEVAALRDALRPERLAAAGVAYQEGRSGRTAEVPGGAHPALAALAGKLEAFLGLESGLGAWFRARVALPGAAHPLHSDDYEIQGARLWISAQVYLSAVEGGRTVFPNASPPLAVQARAGRLLAWFNQDADGEPDAAAEHLFEPVEAGERVTLNWFVYATPEALRAAWRRAREAADLPFLGELDAPPHGDERPALHVIDDGVPKETVRLLREAARARRVPFVRLDPRAVDPRRGPLPPGAMLFCPATSVTAERVEQQLWQPGVATFHRRPEGPFVSTLNPLLAFARAGLPVPRFVWVQQRGRERLREWVDHLGGLPVVVKAGRGEGGVGTLRADSLPALRSLLDLVQARGQTPWLLAYVPDAMHLRLVVVGDRVVTAYRNPVREDDFRSEPSDDPADYDVPVEPEWAAIAVEASRVVGYAFAGVDLLLHPSGRVYLLEANSPCYYPQAQHHGAADVAGAMLDFLLAASATPVPPPERP